MREGKYQVANAWMQGKPLWQGHLMTDGESVYSYAHKIGMTVSSGGKRVICCHASKTTATHCSALRQAGAASYSCPRHRRTDICQYCREWKELHG
jgi:hypothetical protein